MIKRQVGEDMGPNLVPEPLIRNLKVPSSILRWAAGAVSEINECRRMFARKRGRREHKVLDSPAQLLVNQKFTKIQLFKIKHDIALRTPLSGKIYWFDLV